jgi:hypothetical protein
MKQIRLTVGVSSLFAVVLFTFALTTIRQPSFAQSGSCTSFVQYSRFCSSWGPSCRGVAETITQTRSCREKVRVCYKGSGCTKPCGSYGSPGPSFTQSRSKTCFAEV